MSFFENLLQPRGLVREKLDQYKEKGNIDKYCKMVSAIFFLLGFIPYALFGSFFTAILFNGSYGLGGVGAGVGLSLLFGVIAGLSVMIGTWLSTYVMALSAKWLGGNFNVKGLYIAPLTIWAHSFVAAMITVVVAVIAIGVAGQAGLIIVIPLYIWLYVAYGLGITSGSQNISYPRAFGATIIAMILWSIVMSVFGYIISFIIGALLM